MPGLQRGELPGEIPRTELVGAVYEFEERTQDSSGVVLGLHEASGRTDQVLQRGFRMHPDLAVLAPYTARVTTVSVCELAGDVGKGFDHALHQL